MSDDTNSGSCSQVLQHCFCLRRRGRNSSTTTTSKEQQQQEQSSTPPPKVEEANLMADEFDKVWEAADAPEATEEEEQPQQEQEKEEEATADDSEDVQRRSSHSPFRSQGLRQSLQVPVAAEAEIPAASAEKLTAKPTEPGQALEDAAPTKMSDAPKTVTFDVGGVMYKVSRSLVAKYPESKLATLMEEEKSNDNDKPIFVDRNGALFAYVLDYMRDKKAYLPLQVSRGSVMQEYEYFGFTKVPPSAIICFRANLEAALHVAACQKSYETEMKKVLETMDALEADKRYIEMAHRCYQAIVSTGTFDEVQIYNGRGQLLEVQNFEKHLSKYGLKHESNRQDGNYLYVEVAKMED